MTGGAQLERGAVRQIGFDGLSDAERTVLDLHDTGIGLAAIVERTGLETCSVKTILTKLAVTALEPWKDDARRGSAALIAALRQHHPVRCEAAL